MRFKKVFIFFMIIVFFFAQNLPAFAYVLVPEYLCELGIRFYQEGRVSDALYEFSKALIISPGYEPALEYIDMIRQQPPGAPAVTPAITAPPIYKPQVEKPPTLKPRVKTRQETIKELMDRIEKEISPAVLPPVGIPELRKEKIALPQVLLLDENIKTLKSPLEIEKGKSIIIRGRNIQRFLVTQPNVLGVERINSDEILLTGKDFGYTYLHIWDERDRWTLEFLVVPPRPAGPTLEEEMRLAEEKAGTFKLRYSVDWSSYETGRRLDSLERVSYYWTHWLELSGPTPYGNFDSSASLRALKGNTNLSYVTLGLEEGNIGPFKGFSLRGFDYWPGVSNLAFSGVNLRGAMLESPAFNKKIDYTAFWGREGGGRYGGLSPGLVKTRDSFVSGFDINFSPIQKQNYNFSVFHGWGRARPSDLNPYGYDLDIDYRFDKWGLGYEIAYDSQTFAYLLNTNFALPRLKLTTELRNTDKDFKTMTGWGWRAGELGLLSVLSYTPSEALSISSRLDIFQDRLYPNPEDNDRWNEDFNWDANYTIDPLTSLRLDYALQNELGRISPFRSHNTGIGLYKAFDWIKKINTYATYRHQERKYSTSPSGDYINDKIVLGLRFGLIGDLYYFLSREFNWIEARQIGEHSRPYVLESGVDWYGRVLKSLFWGNLRLMYRDEEDATSPFSFLAGEDYIEGYAELSYRPQPDIESFLSARVRNIWAENPTATKRIEANFYAGMRYLWDTGLRWESVGTLEGYVFKDFNGDGLRQRDEPPVEGIKLWSGKDKSALTDVFGYYKFGKIRAKKAYVNIDTASIPSGFVLTVPAVQEGAIVHGRKTELNFGIVSRTDISGVVFEDTNGDGQFGPKDLGIRAVVLILEDGTKAKTDDSGRYSFRKATAGKHTLTLDLNSLPPIYMPAVPIFKDVEVFEGVSYIHNIPLKKIGK